MYIDIDQDEATVKCVQVIFLFSFPYPSLIIGLSKCFALVNENVFGFQKSSILHQGLDSANRLSYVKG